MGQHISVPEYNAQRIFRTYLVMTKCALSSGKFDHYGSGSQSCVAKDGPHVVNTQGRTSN